MKILSVITQKGGAGKTTIATALTVAAEAAGKGTILFDLDPQATACFWSDTRESETPAVKDCSVSRLPHYVEGLRGQGCDLVVVDCPAVHRDIAHDAASISDFVLIPTRADIFDVRSMTTTIEVVRSTGTNHAVVLNFCPPSGQEVPNVKAVIEQIGAPLCPVELHQYKDFARAQQSGLTAQEFAPNGQAAKQIRELYEYTCIHLFGEGRSHGKRKRQQVS